MDQKKSYKRKKIATFDLGKERDYFIENIAMLIKGGVPLMSALDSVKKGTRSKKMVKVIDYIKEDIDNGDPMWKAFLKSNLFSENDVSLIRIGEESGKLGQNLETVVENQEKNRKFRSRIYSAAMYPAFVFFLVLFVGTSLAWFVLPKLTATFSQLRIELPLTTKILIKIGDFLAAYGTYFVPSFILLFLAAFYFIFYFKKTKFIGQFILFSFPITKNLVKELELAKFGYLLGTLLNAGLPIKKALFLISKSTETRQYKRFYNYLEERIKEGDSFEKSFSSFKGVNNLFPVTVQQLIFAGEISGSLSETLLKIGDKFEEKNDNTTKNLTVILEPVMITLVGACVAFVAVAVILPIYSLVGGIESGQQMQRTNDEVDREVKEVVSFEEEVKKIRATSSDPENLIIYKKPSYASEIIDQIMPGGEVYYQKEQKNWYEIILPDGELGWISGEYVEVVKTNEE